MTRTPESASPFSILDAKAFLASLNSAILCLQQVQNVVTEFHKLNAHEQTLICVDIFLTEAEADGVSHFFYYDSAALYEKVLVGLGEIGALDTKNGLRRYVERVFGGAVPQSSAARRDVLDSMDNAESEEAERMVGGFVDATARLAAWARGHSTHFRLR